MMGSPTPVNAYGATKAAIMEHSRYLAAALAKDGIRSNTISPGYVWSGIFNGRIDMPGHDAMLEVVPMHRFGTNDEIASTVLFLASDRPQQAPIRALYRHEVRRTVRSNHVGINSPVARQHLTFPLLSDADLTVHRLYGAYGEKKLYGKVYEGVIRSTFVIDGDGVIRIARYNVRAKGHVDSLLRALDKLDGSVF